MLIDRENEEKPARETKNKVKKLREWDEQRDLHVCDFLTKFFWYLVLMKAETMPLNP